MPPTRPLTFPANQLYRHVRGQGFVHILIIIMKTIKTYVIISENQILKMKNQIRTLKAMHFG